jgi:DNA-directed RNA polymerase subunit RPC12/RpoP
VTTARAKSHRCPACGAGLVSEPIGAPLRCKHCGWHLITLATWRELSPFGKGYAHYMQSAWPTSELAGQKNPYDRGTPDWTDFCRGEARAMQDAQDGEE